MRRILLLVVLLVIILACGVVNLSTAPAPLVPATSSPRILSPTTPFIPSATPGVVTPTPGLTFTSSPSSSATPTSSPTPSTTSTSLGRLELAFRGCETSIDLSHQMGEVTNAYVRLRNFTPHTLANVCTTLSASDEARLHPDKTVCIPSLPAGFQITLKLTVDTGFQQDTSLRADALNPDGINETVTAASCNALGLPRGLPDETGLLVPIP